MAEYIEKEAAVLFLRESAEGLHDTPSWASLLKECADKIADFPATNVREIGPAKTHYDEIMEMSVEELAEWKAYGRCPPNVQRDRIMRCPNFDETCHACWLDWLKSEVEDD